MKIYNLKRGGGKSTRMLYASEYHNAPIICMCEGSRKYLKSLAESLGLNIPEPITVAELADAKTSLNTTDVLVDEMQWVLQKVLNKYGNYRIIGGTLTSDEGGQDDRS